MNAVKFFSFLLALVVSLCALCALALEHDYDIVILNGRVIDPETRFDSVANVGITNGIITAITDAQIDGKEKIDARGHVVTAGFIDTHIHSSKKFNIKMAMMDGVTTAMDYEVGAMNIAKWYEREKNKWPINYGACVSHEMARMLVMDGIDIHEPVDAKELFDLRVKSTEDGIDSWSVTVANKKQINQILSILDENLRQGALCIGATLGYAAKGISSYELFEVQRAAARYQRPISVHTRHSAVLGFAEVFTNAAVLGAPLLIAHNNNYGWWEVEEKLALARSRGLNMWSEYYPYEAGSTAIGAIKPDRVKSGEVIEKIYDPLQGKTLSFEEYKEVFERDPGRTVVAFIRGRKQWIPKWLEVEHMVVASDGMWSSDPEHGWDTDPAEFAGHPRTSGAHTAVLRLGREHNVPLIQTLSQLSYWPALHLGATGLPFFDVRGRVQEGLVADLLVFDPEKVSEGSGYESGTNGLPPIGLPHVIVNGQFVKRDNKAIKAMVGLPVRYPIEKSGRFEPVASEFIK